MFYLNLRRLKKDNIRVNLNRKKRVGQNFENQIGNQVKKVLSNADQGLIVMVRG